MEKNKKGKETVLHCTCPTCETHLIVNSEGDVLQSFYEPNEEKAQAKAEEHLPKEEKKEDDKGGAGERTVSEDAKGEMEEESQTEVEESPEQDEFGGLEKW